MSAADIAELEAQLAQLKHIQATTPREDAENPAMTPRGGGANAVRALRKVGGKVGGDVGNNDATSSVEDEEQQLPPSSDLSMETTTTAAATTTSEQENDDFDLQLYADNGFFPSYVSKTSAAESPSTAQNVESETDKAMKADYVPLNWIARKTRGKFGKIYWYNTVTGATHYAVLPPSPELLAEWVAAAEVDKKKGEEEFKRKQQALLEEAEEVEKQWKLQFEKDRLEKQRVEKERLATQAAAATQIPAWKRRLLERKQKKEGAKFSEEELATLAIMNKSKPAAAAGTTAAAAGTTAAAAGTTATESFTEGNDVEDSKENNAVNPKSPTSPTPAPLKIATDQAVPAVTITSTTSTTTTDATSTPLTKKAMVQPAPLTDFEKLFVTTKKKFFSK